MALTGGGFGTGDFQAQLQTSPLTPDQAKYSTTRHRLGGQACPKRTRTEEQGLELSGAAATRGPCTPAGELGARSDGIPHSHLIWRHCLFHPDFQKFSDCPQTTSFCAERQLSLVPGGCRCLLPAGQGTPCRHQQGRAQVHPKMPQWGLSSSSRGVNRGYRVLFTS